MLAFRYVIVLSIILLFDLFYYKIYISFIKRFKLFYFTVSLLTFIFLICALFKHPANWSPFYRIYGLGLIFVLFISKLTGIILYLLVRTISSAYKIVKNAFVKETKNNSNNKNKISRKEFIKQMAVISSVIPFSTLIYGMSNSAYKINVKRIRIKIPQLPNNFNGLTIVQLSDIHCGSFWSNGPLEKTLKIFNSLKPDLFFFTGDLINELTSETKEFIDILSKFKAELGSYSILGNHDYGDYYRWKSKKEKEENFKNFLSVHKKIGWKLLRNENVILGDKHNKIAILGVENWGKSSRFPKYGNIKLAKKGAEYVETKILLSHDPHHFELIVNKKHKDINLTLSGHTHGFQFGVENSLIKWSPAKYFYKYWAGYYFVDNQHLYVNRGLGFLAYPGRVGIMPEITLIELSNNKSTKIFN